MKLFLFLLMIVTLMSSCGDADTVTCVDICSSHDFRMIKIEERDGLKICYCEDRDTGAIWTFPM